MALIEGKMTGQDKEEVYAVCTHEKVNVPMLEEHRRVRVAWDEESERDERERIQDLEKKKTGQAKL